MKLNLAAAITFNERETAEFQNNFPEFGLQKF